ncbi:MAG: hypothetical protein IJ728_10895 [Selenomonadaceae bacterium]|nr:hypothetical protein [Selenomonadaceae bacterium]
MAMNGIITNDRTSTSNYNSTSKAQFNFNRFNTNVLLDNFDQQINFQKNISEQLSDRIKESLKNDNDGINYALYVKEDEENPENKNKTEDRSQHHHIILNPGASMMKAPGRTSSPAECETCANRKYQDGSDETDVSFQTPSKIPQSIAASVILGHEHEHVANAYEKESQSRVDHDHQHAHVDQASVKLKTDICPECGRVYFSGGVTNTVICYIDDEQYDPESYDPQILIPSSFKNALAENEYLNSLFNGTGAKITYYNDTKNSEVEIDNKDEVRDAKKVEIYVPLTLKDKLSKEDYLQFLEDVTNLKITFYDSPADEEENNKYKPYTMFDERNNNYQGYYVDMNS